MSILEVKNISVRFPIKSGFLSRTKGYIDAVNNISFSLNKGEILGIVGESGSGKTTLSRAILGLQKTTSGQIFYNGCELVQSNRRELARHIGVVFQDPFASLNPRHTVLEILTDAMLVHGLCTKETRREEAKKLLIASGLREDILAIFPHAFSGGQRQRIAIARSLALKPEILILDEAVSALDISVRAQILNLLMDLRDEFGLSYIFITHDIGVVRHISDRVLVMCKGSVVEEGLTESVLAHPQNDYTKELMSAVPKIPSFPSSP